MSKKNKKLAKSVAPKAVKAPKPPKNVVPRKKYTWTERALMRAEKAGKLLNRLAITIASAKPPGFDELYTYVPETPTTGPVLCGGLGVAYEVSQSLLSRLAELPGDFAPKYKRNSQTLAIGSTIGVSEEHATADVFAHIPADLFELGTILGEDGKSNWLIKCTDNVVRTIRKMYVEAVDEGGEDEQTDEDNTDEQLDDEDTDDE